MTNSNKRYIGLMSGTSMDALDAVLVNIDGNNFHLIDQLSLPMPVALRDKCLQLCQPGNNEIDLMGQLDQQLGQWFAQGAQALLEKTNLSTGDICAIGSHGQTIRHRPGDDGFSLQLGNADVIASQTGIVTVTNFRQKDMVLGGQGAPLVPAFHAAWFGKANSRQAIVNIGGMANITLLDETMVAGGHDTGPGNVLMDIWTQKHLQQPCDKDGAWAASGNILPDLFAQLLKDPYFSLPAPKSTGREYFNEQWLVTQMQTADPADIQATLCELTATTIINELQDFKPERILVCGGGAHNAHLMKRLNDLADVTVASTASAGLAPDWVEGCAFAWLAHARLEQLPGNAPSVTGASRPAILGAITAP